MIDHCIGFFIATMAIQVKQYPALDHLHQLFSATFVDNFPMRRSAL